MLDAVFDRLDIADAADAFRATATNTVTNSTTTIRFWAIADATRWGRRPDGAPSVDRAPSGFARSDNPNSRTTPSVRRERPRFHAYSRWSMKVVNEGRQ
jgi:hypothetical protein